MALEQELGQHPQGWGRALHHGNSTPRVSHSPFWVWESSPAPLGLFLGERAGHHPSSFLTLCSSQGGELNP